MRLGMSDGTFNSVYTPSKLLFCSQRMGNLWSLNVYDVNVSMSFVKSESASFPFRLYSLWVSLRLMMVNGKEKNRFFELEIALGQDLVKDFSI